MKAPRDLFIDDILKDPRVSHGLKDSFDGIPIVDCKAVSDFYWQESEQEDWGMKDFPCIAPIDEEVWLDFRAPDHVTSTRFEDRVRPWPKDFPRKWGMYCIGGEVTPELRSFVANMRPWNTHHEHFERLFREVPDIKWCVDLFLDLSVLNELGGLQTVMGYYQWRILIRENGEIAYDPRDNKEAVSGLAGDEAMNLCYYYMQLGMSKDEAELQVYTQVVPYFHCAMLAFSFMHAHNIKLVDADVPVERPSRKALKKDKNAKVYQPVAHKTLMIEPMKQILKHEGKSEEVGTKVAWHKCRSHFKDYRQGAGLFGRVKKLVFFHYPQGRGSTDQGVRTHDYQIKL